MSKRLKLVMTACSLAGLIGALLGLIIGTESVPPNAGFEGPAIIFVWFVGTGFTLALLAGILGWLMREEFLSKTLRYLVIALVVMALVFAGWIWYRNSQEEPPAEDIPFQEAPTAPTTPVSPP